MSTTAPTGKAKELDEVSDRLGRLHGDDFRDAVWQFIGGLESMLQNRRLTAGGVVDALDSAITSAKARKP